MHVCRLMPIFYELMLLEVAALAAFVPSEILENQLSVSTATLNFYYFLNNADTVVLSIASVLNITAIIGLIIRVGSNLC